MTVRIQRESAFPRPLRRGVVLIVTLWVLSILAFLAWNLVQRVRLELALTDYRSDDLQAEVLLDAALARGLWALRQDENTEFDHPGEWQADGTSLTDEGLLPLDDLGAESPRIEWRIEDEGGKINANLADLAVLRSLFETYYGFDIEAESLAEYMVDWTDEDDEGSAERDYYETLPSPYVPRNEAFPYLDELRLVRDVTPELYEFGVSSVEDTSYEDISREDPDGDGLDGAGGLMNILTVEGDGTLNVNTAPRRVLEALFRTLTDVAEAGSLARVLDQRRRGSDGRFGTADDEPFLDASDLADYVPEEMVDQAAAYGVPLGVRSGAYTLRASVSFESRKIERTGWARIRGSGPDLELVAWNRMRYSRRSPREE
jgi:type II secretory pathway component PulK